MSNEFSDSTKISLRSIGEVVERFSAIVGRLRRKQFVFRGKRVTREAVGSALILWLDAQPHEDQERIMTYGLRALDALMGDRPTSAPANTPQQPLQVDVKIEGETVPDVE